MNVEGDYRYADAGAFDECASFLDYMGEHGYDWEEAFVNWISVAEKWREDHSMPQGYWDPWNLVKVVKFSYVNQDLMPFNYPRKSTEGKKHRISWYLDCNSWVSTRFT